VLLEPLDQDQTNEVRQGAMLFRAIFSSFSFISSGMRTAINSIASLYGILC
jgi:hypothetical protein